MSITTVFTPPLVSDSPEVFNSKAFTLVGGLNTWSGEANTLAAAVTTKAGEAATSAASVGTSAATATTKASEAAASAAAIGTTATTSTTKAGEAATSALKAQAWADNVQNMEVETGKYSAKHWAMQAQATVTGSLTYRGSLDASSGNYPVSPVLGDYYKISVSGTISTVLYNANDSIIYNGLTWDKIDSTDSVSSVSGKTGTVTLSGADVGLGSVDNTADTAKPVSTLQAAAIAAAVYTHPANHPASVITQDTNNRFVTDAEKTTWNSKLPASDVYAWAKAATKPSYTAAEVGLGNVPNLAFSGSNTGDETTATIKTKLSITTLSGSNTGDQVIPTTLPASDVYAWAKAATKPSYTPAEVAAQPLDADLTAIAALAATAGLLKKTAADTWTLDTAAYTTNLGTVTGVTGTAPIVSSGGTTPAISISAATTITAGSMSAADKTKLDGVATGATAYAHPANHAASVITQDASNRFVTDAEKTTWNDKQATLVSGTNIKTINSTSLLGTGDIALVTQSQYNTDMGDLATALANINGV